MTKSELSPPSPKSSQPAQGSINVYAVHCGKCSKWRVLSTPEEFEELRSNLSEDPYQCNKKPGVTCEDPADIEYDATRTWIIDKPNLPKTPKGFKRRLVLRKDFSKLDTYYVAPSGKRLRSPAEIAAYVQANPEHKGISLSDFIFQSPKVMEDTIPENVEKKVTVNRNKKVKSCEEVDV